jgi:hypothetical protein
MVSNPIGYFASEDVGWKLAFMQAPAIMKISRRHGAKVRSNAPDIASGFFAFQRYPDLGAQLGRQCAVGSVEM